MVVHGLYVLGVARNGPRLFCRFFCPNRSRQPHDSIFVGVDVNAPQALYMLTGQFCLDFRCDRGVFHKRARVSTIRIRILRSGQRREPERGRQCDTRYRRYFFHVHSN